MLTPKENYRQKKNERNKRKASKDQNESQSMK